MQSLDPDSTGYHVTPVQSSFQLVIATLSAAIGVTVAFDIDFLSTAGGLENQGHIGNYSMLTLAVGIHEQGKNVVQWPNRATSILYD